MALNIFPRQPRRESVVQPEPAPAPEPEPQSPPAAAESDATPARRSTRSRRGGRSAAARTADAEATTVAAPPDEPVATPTLAEPPADAAEPAPRRRRSRGGRKADEGVEAAVSPDPATPLAAAPAVPATGRRTPAGSRTTADAPFDPAALVRAMEQQGKQIEALTRTLQDVLQGVGRPAVQPARIGVFVDVANVELGADRARVRFDWGKVLRLLTRDRILARAVAYAPVHDDPQVSRETQRFVEPFLDHGYKIVTKPLKRFADGSVKANVDIELALDVVNMLDRLDVVCLVSGDGDFEPLVRAAQERGVRVEVAAMGNSCAANLRNAADGFVDLLTRTGELRA